jgi:hypothetical protein
VRHGTAAVASWRGPLVAVAIGLFMAVAALGVGYEFGHGGGTQNGTGTLDPNAPSCLASDPQVSDPTAPHGEFVLAPPLGPHNEYYSDVQNYLLNNPVLCGADFWVTWASVESGTLTHPVFNFSAVDAEAAPWIAAGKEVNLLFMPIGTTPSGQDVPGFVLAQVPTLQCGPSAVTPVEWNATFESAYEAFIAAAVHHYDATPGFGYLRFGLGVAGTPVPVGNDTVPGCQTELDDAGFSLPVWTDYVTDMLAFQQSLHSTVPLTASISPIYPNTGDNVTPTVAAASAADGIGFGNQGFKASDYATVEPNGVGCGGNGWCKEFWKYAGTVPLELQTQTVSSPNGSGVTGSLVPLLPFGLRQHTQIFELYLNDWLTAFDPNYPLYAQYHVAYAQVLTQVADVVGTD